MRFEQKENCIYMSVAELASYAFQRENASQLIERFGFLRYIAPASGIRTMDELTPHVMQPDALHRIESVQNDVPLEKNIPCADYSLCVQGYAARIIYDGVLYTIEENKILSSFKPGLTPFENPAQFAQAVIYAYLFANSTGLSEIKIRISFTKRSTGDQIFFVTKFTQIALSRMFDALLDRAHTMLETFAERYTVFPEEAKNMPFPYHSIRDGQSRFIKMAYRTIRQGQNLLVSAPTGIGKTMSSLFAAVKAIGSGTADRIFYLTAKTIIGQEALRAVQRMSKYAPHLRTVMICAKEQVCPYRRNSKDDLVLSCRDCEKTAGISPDFGITYISYRERMLSALNDLLLSKNTVYTQERVYQTADKHNVCPYELSLDLSE